MKLSILICTLPQPYRDSSYSVRLIDDVTRQAEGKPVEVLYLGDNKSMTVGRKRNLLLSIAIGERIIFLDDDDLISDDYVDTLLDYCNYSEDCIAIGVQSTENGTKERTYDYSFKKNINTRIDSKSISGRMPNHLCLWKKEIAQRVEFYNQSLGEDHAWAEEQIVKGYTLKLTEKILYYYLFDSENTQTRLRR